MRTFDVPESLLPGAVIVLPFPYADRLAEKRRPALVVSSRDFARRHGRVWGALITSAENAGWKDDVEIAVPAHSGLRAPSIIRPAKLATVDLARIVRTLGKVDDQEFASVRRAINRSLG